MKIQTDIDIDCQDRDALLAGLKHVAAGIRRDGKMEKHNTGVYFHPIPCELFTGISTIDYKEAEELGYFKLDFLNVSIYKDVRDEAHLIELINKEPDWTLLDYPEVIANLFHINNYADLVTKLRPRTVEQLAAVLAVIRPSKRHLQTSNWETIEREVWIKPTDGTYHFKRAHGIAYATAICVQLNLLQEQA